MSYKTGYKFNYAVYNFSDIMGKSFFISLNRALANILKILLVIAILAAAAFLFVLSKDEFYLFLLLILFYADFYLLKMNTKLSATGKEIYTLPANAF